jgi:hypothetical protein
LEKEDIPTLVEKNKNNTMNKNNPKDEVTFNIPLLIRFAELMREDIKTDVALHEVIENIIDIKDKGVLTMSDYDSIIGNVIGTEENTNMNVVEEEKMEEGGKVESIKSKKGDIKLMLDEKGNLKEAASNWGKEKQNRKQIQQQSTYNQQKIPTHEEEQEYIEFIPIKKSLINSIIKK